MDVTHLPYSVAPRTNRFHFYENYWKRVGLNLLLQHTSPKGKTVLDYGCGRGEALPLFAEAGFDITGADADPECVRLSSEHGRAALLDVNDPLAQFGPKSFDVVACFHVLEHVSCPKSVLSVLSEIAREHVLVAVPNLRTLMRLLSRNVRSGEINEGHLQGWDHWHLLNLAEKHCNLELVEWGFDATILPVFNRFLERWFGTRAAIWAETGPFLKLFPWHCHSVLALFRPRR